MEGSESMSLATLFHLFMTGRRAARQLLRFLRFLLFKFFMEKDGLFRRCLSLTSEQEATEDDKWRDRRACLWPRFFIYS